MLSVGLTEVGIATGRARYKAMGETFTAAPRPIAKQGAGIILHHLKAAAPRGEALTDSQHLWESLDFTLTRIGTDTYSARFTGPYYTKWVIEGRGEVWAGIYTGRSTKKFLHFFIDGKEIFTTHVKAAAPNDFRIPAMVSARPELQSLMHEAGVRTIRGELWAEEI